MSLIRTRLLIIQYLIRLNTYEELNGGYQSEKAKKDFNSDDYENFREQNLVEYSAELARKGDWKNVETLLVFHHKVNKEKLANVFR